MSSIVLEASSIAGRAAGPPLLRPPVVDGVRPLGQILLERRLIDAQGLAAGLQRKATTFGTLGENLVELGLVSEEAVLECLAEQLPVMGEQVAAEKPKAIALLEVEIAPEVKASVPIALLLKHRAMPLMLSSEKKELTLAMADAQDHAAIKELEFATTRRIRRCRPTTASSSRFGRNTMGSRARRSASAT